jgi:hypothetical protein
VEIFIEVIQRTITYISSKDTDRIENEASNNFSTVARVFVVEITFLVSRYLSVTGYTYINTKTDEWDL